MPQGSEKVQQVPSSEKTYLPPQEDSGYNSSRAVAKVSATGETNACYFLLCLYVRVRDLFCTSSLCCFMRNKARRLGMVRFFSQQSIEKRFTGRLAASPVRLDGHK